MEEMKLTLKRPGQAVGEGGRKEDGIVLRKGDARW